MPPKPKFTQEDILQTAFEIVRAQGIEGLTARSIGDALGTSPRPIFTLFDNMEHIRLLVKQMAMQACLDYLDNAAGYTPAFKMVGILMVDFAKAEPHLFRLAFMHGDSPDASFREMSEQLPLLKASMDLIESEYGLGPDEARIVFEQTWTHAFALGALCATGSCTLSEEEVSAMLGRSFLGTLLLIKTGGLDLCSVTPVRREEAGPTGLEQTKLHDMMSGLVATTAPPGQTDA